MPARSRCIEVSLVNKDAAAKLCDRGSGLECSQRIAIELAKPAQVCQVMRADQDRSCHALGQGLDYVKRVLFLQSNFEWDFVVAGVGGAILQEPTGHRTFAGDILLNLFQRLAPI